MLETLAERLAKVKAYSICETLGDVLATPRVNAAAESLAELEAETSGFRLGDVDTEALLYTLVNSLEKVEIKTLIDS